MLDKGMTSIPARRAQSGAIFHYIAHNSGQLKTYEWFISGIFHLKFLDLGCLQVTEIMENKTMDKK